MSDPTNCPFCRNGFMVEVDNNEYHEWVVCQECGARGPMKKDMASAIESWNNRSLPRICDDMALALDAAQRVGAEKDEPEGTRLVVLSDTVARQIADTLRGKP